MWLIRRVDKARLRLRFFIAGVCKIKSKYPGFKKIIGYRDSGIGRVDSNHIYPFSIILFSQYPPIINIISPNRKCPNVQYASFFPTPFIPSPAFSAPHKSTSIPVQNCYLRYDGEKTISAQCLCIDLSCLLRTYSQPAYYFQRQKYQRTVWFYQYFI